MAQRTDDLIVCGNQDHHLDPGIFTPQPIRAVGVLFSPMVSGWAGGRREIVCPGCISETVRCRKFILGRDIGCGV